MRRILLKVAYDGTDFHGYAAQENARTVEGVLAEAIAMTTGETVVLTGASRTDAGVHAYGNLATFDTASSIPAEKFAQALNTRLPMDARVVSSREVSDTFHPRKTGWLKTYEYRILNTDAPDPVRRRYTYHYRAPLDVAAMDAAGKRLIGEHDFTSFCSVHSLSPTRTRRITNVSVAKHDDGAVVITVVGSGFLYHMVRIIAGTLLDVGRGRLTPDDVTKILEAKDRTRAGKTLDPQGLFLIGYEEN